MNKKLQHLYDGAYYGAWYVFSGAWVFGDWKRIERFLQVLSKVLNQ